MLVFCVGTKCHNKKQKMANQKGGAAEPEGPPLSELESLQLNINQTTDDSLESTRRMKNMCEEAKASGIKTLVRYLIEFLGP